MRIQPLHIQLEEEKHEEQYTKVVMEKKIELEHHAKEYDKRRGDQDQCNLP